MTGVVVVGAGQAGASLAFRLRALGYSGSITLVGDEDEPPYERPPLSKAYLLGKRARDRLHVRPLEAYAANGIDLILGTRVDMVDRERRRIRLEGFELKYEHLVLTTGSSAVRLPAAVGGDLECVHAIRTLADVDALAPFCIPGKRALVIGGGYVGLETAAVMRGLDMDVTLVEASDRILKRVASMETSDLFRRLHAASGVRIVENSLVERLVASDNGCKAVLGDASLEVDVVVVGIGIVPADGLARRIGLSVADGIVVDARGRTSDPNVWAAGDCARFPYRTGTIRLESVQNATEQAALVAENIMGAGRDYSPVPWFWSDQYGTKLQIAGLSGGSDRVVVRQGDRDDSVSHWYFAGDRLLAVDAVNDARSYMFARRALARGMPLDALRIADSSLDLKSLLK